MKTSDLTKCVCVWLDTVSEPGTETWIVSEDTITLPSGGAEDTHTINCLDADEYTQADAIEDARSEAEERRLPLYLNLEGQDVELIHDYSFDPDARRELVNRIEGYMTDSIGAAAEWLDSDDAAELLDAAGYAGWSARWVMRETVGVTV